MLIETSCTKKKGNLSVLLFVFQILPLSLRVQLSNHRFPLSKQLLYKGKMFSHNQIYKGLFVWHWICATRSTFHQSWIKSREQSERHAYT